MNINFAKLEAANELIKEVNSLELEDVANQYGNYWNLKIPDSIIKEWKFTGLNNNDFISMVSIEQIKAGTIFIS